ncbi:alkylresorcinol/alkylpyrone synthase [Nonomuraea solani]|uniref:Alkylresorcinol/alkylpyrone synthase n=1 Tax=Nonomuraea solani TaxID=1144553 RepID=A0A1H6EPF9_9ACTN|nr:PhlD [Nonomuraea solani]SEG99758.1 alkylresorcinol/alkylpyrone synthase [Nonomuraea solani]
MPHITRPEIVLPEHWVSTDDLIEHFSATYAGHPRLQKALDVMRATTVRGRRFSRPLTELTDADHPTDLRLQRHFEDSCHLAEEAARRAVKNCGLDLDDIDTLVCASITGYAMPGLDTYLVNSLPLPPTVRRLPVTQMGCNGGAYSLARAAEQCTSPGHNALVVGADLPMHYVHPDDTGMDVMIFRALVGDAAGACVVRGHDTLPGLRIDQSWDYVQPETAAIVGSRVRQDGMHLFNSPQLYDALRDILHELTGWLEKTSPTGTDPRPEFLVGHTGGPKIMETLFDALGLDPSLAHISRQSLQELGNAGAVSILDVLARTYDSPPPAGAHGLSIGVGPGLSVTASRLRWQ